MKYVCSECGSDDVDGTTWVELNTGNVKDDEPPLDSYWCNTCEEECHVEMISEPCVNQVLNEAFLQVLRRRHGEAT